jgi:hypothetical protein|tara:strand:+ start:769 stop:1065 length:297 start_codon:yes stop_codon:yes gene_type:complete
MGTGNNYKYPFRYCNSRRLCEVHGIQYRTLERWISEEKAKGKTIPGRIKIPGTRSFIFDAGKFHDEFLVPRIFGPVRNEHEKQEHLVIINNQQRKVIQ